MEEPKSHETPSRKNNIKNSHPLDKIKLAHVFPEEIHTLIFEYYASSVDIRNVAKASKYFEVLLSPLRTQWLFSFVWQLITAKLVIQDSNQYAEWWKSLLTIRLVCRTWSKSVDHTFERVETNYLHNRELGFPSFARDFMSRCSLYASIQGCSVSERKLNNFFEYFKTTQSTTGRRGPPSKTLYINSQIQEIARANSSRNTFMEILWMCGKSFRHCSYRFCDVEQFCQFLAYMPNLQTLRVIYVKQLNQNGIFEYPPTEMAKWPRKSFPYLRNLVFLDVECAPHNIVHALVSQCRNISGFRYFEEGFGITDLLAHPLKQLQICVNITAYTVLETKDYLWPLTHLELRFEKNCFVEWPELFDLLHQSWNKTLKRLKISLPGTNKVHHVEQVVNWSLMPLLKLKKLTHLNLVMNCVHAVDFILPLRKTLEYFHLCFDYKPEDMPQVYRDDVKTIKVNHVIKNLGYAENGTLLDSNIWTLFPNLKEVHHHVYGSPKGRIIASRSQFDNLNNIWSWKGVPLDPGFEWY